MTADPVARNAAVYFPRVLVADPLTGTAPRLRRRAAPWPGSTRGPTARAACGRRRPGPRPSLIGVTGLTVPDRPRERAAQPAGRQLPAHVPGRRHRRRGARARWSAPTSGLEWKYVPVRRTALFIEESLFRGTKWVVFEPNDEPLWAQIRLNVGAFMHEPVPSGRVPGRDPARGVLRQVRHGDDHAERHRPRHRQHRRRFRAAQAGRVRGHQDPADGRPRCEVAPEERSHGAVHRQRQRVRPVQELQVPGEVGTDRYVAGVSKVERAEADHRSGRSTARAATQHRAASRPAAPSTSRSRWSAGSPTTSSSSSGPTRCGTSARGLGKEVSLKDFRKDLIIEVYNEAGQLALLQGVSVLGVGVPGAARPGRERQRGRHPTHQAGERGVEADNLKEPDEAQFTEPSA